MALGKRLINTGGGGGFDVSKLVQTQSRGTIAYGAVAVSPNGRWVLYGGYKYSPVWDDVIAIAELTTPYDLTTFIERSYSLVNGIPITGRGAYINNDGNKIAYTSSDSIIRSFNLSSPGQVADFFYFGTGSANFGSAVDTIYFNNDGSKQFVTQYNVSRIAEYNSSANPFRISTSNNYSYYLPSVSGNWNTMWGISFTNDGTKMLVNQATEKKIFQYTLATPFDARTAVYDGIEFFHNITDAWYLTISEDDLSVFIGRDGAVYKFEFS